MAKPRNDETSASRTPTPASQDGEAALERVRPRAMALDAARVAQPTINLRAAGQAALRLSARLTPTEARARFVKLAQSGLWSTEALESLEDLGRAAVFLRRRIDQTVSTVSSAQVPEKTLQRAQEVRARMRKVTEFHFDDDAEVGPLLAFLRKGTGYQDLADDLVAYAGLYRKHHAVVSATPTHYRVTDLTDAQALSREILECLGLSRSGELEALIDLQARVCSLLVAAYEEVRAAGLFLDRALPDVDARYPSLYTVTRGGPRSRTPDAEDEPVDPTPPDAPKPAAPTR